ncbi:sunset domain-containing protein [Microbacterium sp. TNHR37B]|uniref:sunset domain-containing protein n=1 Tax=Microbacterium sp. TNHR37B TaxID=1775956 RepID=UPI0007B1E255|nr:hypothetical protein [Microbacterium sp. TNHR37B]KZE90039.1 hypothetical protein AVP41_02842 [Microbacterium sp. TNHR37B]
MHTPFTGRRRIAALLLTAAFVSAGATVSTPATAAPPTTSATVAPAPAAPAKNTVTFGKVTAKTAPYKGKSTVKPNVKTTGKVTVSKKTLTVKKGSRTVAKNKTSVKLSAGTYRVTQKVTYRTYSTKTTTTRVKKKVVGVEASQDVAVKCVASGVTPQYDTDGLEMWGADIVARCTSPRFDGSITFAGYLMNFDDEWWGFSDSSLDELTATSLPTVGIEFSATFNPDRDLMKTTYVTQKKTTKVYSGTKTKTSKAQTLVVKQKKKPSSVWGTGGYNCPAGYPIKGNADSGIYHVPGGAYYSRTIPEECFATEAAARAAGYRKSKR